jgi:polysaccharide export outer membrane protein
MTSYNDTSALVSRRLSRRMLALAPVLAAGVVALAPGWVQAQATAAAPSAANAQYRLAAGDVIRISVYQSADLTLETRLTEAGTISYPLLGSVALAGLTVTEAERRIADGLRSGNFVKQPQVSIAVQQVRGNQVSVLGQVGRPGRYPLETGNVQLTDMIATAGGVVGAGADVIVIVGTRNGQPYRAEIDLPSVFGPGRRNNDLMLQNGDVIWVDRAPMIFMYGEVQRPGSMRLERGMTVMQALASAGGLTQRGTERGLRVHRRDAQGQVRVIEPAMTDKLQADDIVYIRESVF